MHGDREFWEWLRRELWRAITRLCPTSPADWREDVVQDAVMRILKLVEEGKRRPEDISRAYARRTAFTVMVNTLKSKHARQEPMEPEDAESIATDMPDPEEQAHAAQLGRRIQAAMARLGQSRRRVFQLCVILGYSVPEAARILSYDRKKTENLLNRGRDQMREWLAEKEEEEVDLLGPDSTVVDL